MAIWVFKRTDTGQEVEVSANGKRMARAKATIELGITDKPDLLSQYFSRAGRVKNGNKPHTRGGQAQSGRLRRDERQSYRW